MSLPWSPRPASVCQTPSPTSVGKAGLPADWKILGWGGTCKELVRCFLSLCRSSRRCLSGMSTNSTTPGAHCAILRITSSGTEKFSLFSTFLGDRHRDGGLGPQGMN